MTRAGAAAGGILLALLLAASLNLPLQGAPLVVALPAAALLALAVARPGAGVLAALALVPLVPVLGNLVHGPRVAPAVAVLLACGAGLLLARPSAAGVPPTLLGLALATAAAAGAAGGIAATLAALPAWALPGALASLARNLGSVRPEEAAAPLAAAAVHALPLAAYLAVARLAAPARRRALALLVGSLSLAAAWSLVEAAGGPRLWPLASYDRFAHFGRAVSTIGDHNAAAALFLLLVFPAAGYAAASRGAARIAGAAAAALLAAGLLATGSRAAWLCGALAALVLLARAAAARRFPRAALATALAAAVVLAVLFFPGSSGPMLRQRIGTLAPAPAAAALRHGRLPFWRTGVRMVAAHPLSGVGPGRVPAEFASYRPASLSVARENLHSWPLQCLAENGVPGGLLLLAPFAALVPLLSRGARRLRGAASGLVPGLAAAGATGLVSHPWLLPEVQVVFWASAALLERALADEAPEEVPAPAPRLRRVAAAAVAAWALPLFALAPGREAGRFGYGGWGFDEGEGHYQWIGPEAALWVRPSAPGAPLVVAVRRPEPERRTEDAVVSARAGFGAWRSVRPDDRGWSELPLAPGVPSRGATLVELRASRAFCPAESGGDDRRVLSVQLRRP